MNWPQYRETITVCDLLDAGACFEGVVEGVVANGSVIVIETDKAVGKQEWIDLASNNNGYGNGNGYGDGDGNGYGNGNGDGYGNGNGDGYGNGESE